jgi:hypothetical protein
MHSVLPRQGVDPQELVHHQRPKCEGKRYEDCQDGPEDHEKIPAKVDQGFPHQEGDPAHPRSPPVGTRSGSTSLSMTGIWSVS